MLDDNKIKVLIVGRGQESVGDMLLNNLSVSGVEWADDTDEAIKKTIACNPGLILLACPVCGNSLKELLDLVKGKSPAASLVITSDTKDYAAFAIQNGIFSYLLNPLTDSDLRKVVAEACLKSKTHFLSLLDRVADKSVDEIRIKLQTTRGYFMLNPGELLFCKATGFYTELHLTRDRVELSGQPLVKLEEMLVQYQFMRISRSYLINKKYIRKIHRAENLMILVHDGKEYKVKIGRTYALKLFTKEIG